MKKSCDDPTIVMEKWPFLRPEDFVSEMDLILMFLDCSPCIANVNFPAASSWAAHARVATLISEGYLRALVSDLAALPRHWEGLLRDFPSHPVQDPGSSIPCTLY